MEKYCDKFDNSCRERVRDKYDRTCFVCNVREDVDARRLSVHHVDKNRGQGCNNVDWKLVPLCASCHASAHHEPLMSRIDYLILHEKDIVLADYKQIYITQEEYVAKNISVPKPTQLHNPPMLEKKIIVAIDAGMCHIDSIAIYVDSSEAYTRRICNELASRGDIQKIKGKLCHTYLPIGDTNE